MIRQVIIGVMILFSITGVFGACSQGEYDSQGGGFSATPSANCFSSIMSSQPQKAWDYIGANPDYLLDTMAQSPEIIDMLVQNDPVKFDDFIAENPSFISSNDEVYNAYKNNLITNGGYEILNSNPALQTTFFTKLGEETGNTISIASGSQVSKMDADGTVHITTSAGGTSSFNPQGVEDYMINIHQNGDIVMYPLGGEMGFNAISFSGGNLHSLQDVETGERKFIFVGSDVQKNILVDNVRCFGTCTIGDDFIRSDKPYPQSNIILYDDGTGAEKLATFARAPVEIRFSQGSCGENRNLCMENFNDELIVYPTQDPYSDLSGARGPAYILATYENSPFRNLHVEVVDERADEYIYIAEINSNNDARLSYYKINKDEVTYIANGETEFMTSTKMTFAIEESNERVQVERKQDEKKGDVARVSKPEVILAAYSSGEVYSDNTDIETIRQVFPHLDDQFLIETKAIAEDIGVDHATLIGVMNLETIGSFDPATDGPGSATGLIQFTEITAKDLGTTTAALSRMSSSEQLQYVKAYYEKRKGQYGSFHRPVDLYLATIWPPAIGKPKNHIVFPSGSRTYNSNRIFDQEGNNDGQITVQEMEDHFNDVNKRLFARTYDIASAGRKASRLS